MACLETSCCGLKLKTGTIFIGVFHFLSFLLELIRMIQSSVSYGEKNKQASMVIELVAIALGILITALLIIGAAKERKWLILPWIVGACLGLLFLAFSIISLLFVLFKNDGQQAVIFSLIAIVVFALEVYLIAVVISHFLELKEMDETRNRPQREVVYLPEGSGFTTDLHGIPTAPHSEAA